MKKLIGIDGGGSQIRVVIADENLNVLGQAQGAAVNPNGVGYGTAQERIVNAIHTALQTANLSAAEIDAVGIGVAGAPASLAEEWLTETVRSSCPHAEVVCSSDQEIALVGAHGQPYGLLLLAGTGSLAYGMTQDGDSALVGGWGYLNSDEGSGYWIGNQALSYIFKQADGRLTLPSILPDTILRYLDCRTVWDLLTWRYQVAKPRDVAKLAPLVLRVAADGDILAQQIVNGAVAALLNLLQTVQMKLELSNAPVAFTGGLLTSYNALTVQVLAHLGLQELPVAQYPAMLGAVILARKAIKNA